MLNVTINITFNDYFHIFFIRCDLEMAVKTSLLNSAD